MRSPTSLRGHALGEGDAHLLAAGVDVQWLRAVARMRVARPGVHLELSVHLAAERVVGEHAFDGALDEPLGEPRADLRHALGAQPARVAGVTVVELVAL